MLAAVAPDSRYENLREYIIANGAGGRPTAVRAFDQSARQPVNLPTGTLPGVKTPIPNSSARPGKQTNQRIPYARLCFNFPADGNPLIKQEIQEGDISFVHRPSNSNVHHCIVGHGVNRASTIGNITQVNVMLANHNLSNMGINIMAPNLDPFGIQRVPDINEATGVQRVDSRGVALFRTATWNERWTGCEILQRWTPDGVIIGSEHQHGTPMPLVGSMASNPGDLWNICVQGPTPLKNNYVAPGDFAHKYTEQNIDSGPRVLDKVFVGLFARENRDAAGVNQYYSYSWKPFTSRQAMSVDLAAAVGSRAAPASGSMNLTSGPTNEEFVRLVAAWRVGTIMDSHLAKERVQLNVIIEQWPLEWLREQYNVYVGASVAMRMRTTGAALQNALAVLAAINAVLINGALRNRFQTLAGDFDVADATMRDPIDPFGFGKTVDELDEELRLRVEWDERSAVWEALTEAQKRKRKRDNPGPMPPPPSEEMKRFFLKMNAYDPVDAFTRLFLEEVIDPATALPTGDSTETTLAVLVSRAATFVEDEILYASFDEFQQEEVAQARELAALIAKLRAPIQLFLRISVIRGLPEWANPQDGGGGDLDDDDGVGVGDLDADDF